MPRNYRRSRRKRAGALTDVVKVYLLHGWHGLFQLKLDHYPNNCPTDDCQQCSDYSLGFFEDRRRIYDLWAVYGQELTKEFQRENGPEAQPYVVAKGLVPRWGWPKTNSKPCAGEGQREQQPQ